MTHCSAMRWPPLMMRLGTCLAGAALVAASVAAGPVKFYVTQPFPGSVPLYGCEGMSADGRVAVGWVDNPLAAFMFDQAWLLTPCSTIPLPDLGFGATARAASNKATVIVGSITNPFIGGGVDVAVRWDAPAYAFTALPTLGGNSAHANAITPDGSVIVGWSQDPSGVFQGAFWALGAPPVGVGNLPGYSYNLLLAVAPDASAAVGHAISTSGTRATWFRPGVGLALIPNPPGGVFQYATGVSNAPNLIVGWGTIGTTTRALVSDGVNTVSLGTLPNDTGSRAYGIAADGSAVIGESTGNSSSPFTISRAFLFTAPTGMIDLQAAISGALGYTGFGPWVLIEGRSVSSGLRAFAGTAVNPVSGDYAGFLINLCPADFNRDGVTDLNDFGDFVAAFNAGRCEADLDEDGLFTSNDFAHFFSSVAAGC